MLSTLYVLKWVNYKNFELLPVDSTGEKYGNYMKFFEFLLNLSNDFFRLFDSSEKEREAINSLRSQGKTVEMTQPSLSELKLSADVDKEDEK